MTTRLGRFSRTLATLVVVTALASCNVAAASRPRDAMTPDVAGELQGAFERFVADHPKVPGAVLDVDAPSIGLSWAGAAGRFAFSDDRPIESTDAFRTASVTKTFTAAAVLRLVEEGELSLGNSIAGYLPNGLVRRIDVIDDHSFGRRITVRQLLNHTSGIYDYATDPGWRADVQADPQRTWQPRELVHVAIRNGDPYFPPGRGFHYSDTGYTLLGLIVQEVTDLPLAAAYRALLPISRLGLDDTYLEGREPAPAGAAGRAHQYIDDVDTVDWNPSFDNFGGGGLISTADDLDSFVRALFDGEIFDEPSTLTTMLRVSRHANYALGLFRDREVGLRAWNHTGFFGSFMYFVPSLDLSFAGSVNQATTPSVGLVRSVIRIVRTAEAAR
jgi:D-alanyl-D-alanine carboxypeptidase